MANGMSPRKEMAGAGSGSNFGVEKFPPSGSAGQTGFTAVPPETGRMSELGDSERGAKERVPGMGAQHGRQAAPDHGPIPDHFKRGGKV